MNCNYICEVLSYNSYFYTYLFISGVHELGAKSTPTVDCFFGERKGQKNPFLPISPTEFQKMLDLVLHQPKRFSLPKHLVKAILKVHMKHYPYFEKCKWIYVKMHCEL